MQYVQALFFPHMRLENLFNEELLEDVYDALAAAGNFETRSNDLYLFSQSQDLRSLGEQHPRIAELATALYSKEMILFLSQVIFVVGLYFLFFKSLSQVFKSDCFV